MPTQTNVEMTAAHMNYRVSKKKFKWQGRLQEGRESLNDDSHNIPARLREMT